MSLMGDSFRDYRTLVSSPIIPARVLTTSKASDVTQVWSPEKPLSLEPLLYKDDLYAQLNTVAVDWIHWRQGLECPCKKKFDMATTRLGTYCRTCGHPFCVRCIEKAILPGHYSGKEVPVCTSCIQKISHNDEKTEELH